MIFGDLPEDDDRCPINEQELKERVHCFFGAILAMYLLIPAIPLSIYMFLAENPFPERHASFLRRRALAIELDYMFWSLGFGAYSGESWTSTQSGLDYQAWRRAMHDSEFADKYEELLNRDCEHFVCKEDLEELLKT